MDPILDRLDAAFRDDGRKAPLMPWQILALFAGVQENMNTIGTAAQKATERVEDVRRDATQPTFVPLRFSIN
jgi:hypothetical protein